jgi:hypothetical protein
MKPKKDKTAPARANSTAQSALEASVKQLSLRLFAAIDCLIEPRHQLRRQRARVGGGYAFRKFRTVLHTEHAARTPNPRPSSSQLTHRWREMDSNHRYRIRDNPFFAAPVRSRNSLSATKIGSFVPGTDGSNPSPSSGESTANFCAM